MRKTIIRSALICLAAIVTAFVLIFGITSLASPVTMAKWSKSLGLNNAAIRYYKSAYERNKDFSVLADLVNTADIADDDDVLCVYGVKFISSDKFNDYCAEYDKNSNLSLSSYNYYCHIVIGALYDKGEIKTAADIAVSFTYEYTRNSPLGTAIMIAVINNDDEFSGEIVRAYELKEHNIDDVSGTLDEDIMLLNK